MAELMIIPADWLAEADMQNFRPAQRGFRCDTTHDLIALADIEVPMRNPGVTLDANGFRHDRMLHILVGIRDNVSLPGYLH